MPKPIKDSDLKAVIAALESDLNTAYEAAKPGLLAKADDDSKEPKKDGPPAESSDDSAAPPAADSAAPSAPPSAPDASAAPAGPAPDASGAAPASPAPDASGAAPGGDPAAAQPQLTPEALQAEYAQLPPEELEMHIQSALAAKEALAASAAAAQPPAAPAASAAPAVPPAAPPAASPAVPPALKGELSAVKAPAGTPGSHAKASGGQMNKSEDAEVEALKKSLAAKDAELSSIKEDVVNLTKAVTMVLERPERKAVTGISYLKKAEEPEAPAKKEFTAAEAKAKIAELIPVLSKSERDVVLAFSVGKVGVDKLAPILEKHVK